MSASIDWQAEFPALGSGRIHMNHCGISPITRRARQAMRDYADDAADRQGISNPRWYAAVADARAQAARLIGAGPAEIAFTKSTTHGLLIVANSIEWKPGDCIVVDERTFPSNWHAWKPLEERFGVRLLAWPERERAYETEDLSRLLAENDVRMVSVSSADFATGFQHDLGAVGRIARDAGALYCIDAIQSIGAVPVNVRDCQADFVSADGHKWMLGPEGCGFLFVRSESLDVLQPWLCGWLGRENFTRFSDQNLPPDPTARRFEEGALNHAGIHALGGSLSLFNEIGMETVRERLAGNVAILRKGMAALGWTSMSPQATENSCGITAFSHPEREPEKIVAALQKGGIVATSRRGWLRLAPHFYQPPEDMHRVLAAVAEAA